MAVFKSTGRQGKQASERTQEMTSGLQTSAEMIVPEYRRLELLSNIFGHYDAIEMLMRNDATSEVNVAIAEAYLGDKGLTIPAFKDKASNSFVLSMVAQDGIENLPGEGGLGAKGISLDALDDAIATPDISGIPGIPSERTAQVLKYMNGQLESVGELHEDPQIHKALLYLLPNKFEAGLRFGYFNKELSAVLADDESMPLRHHFARLFGITGNDSATVARKRAEQIALFEVLEAHVKGSIPASHRLDYRYGSSRRLLFHPTRIALSTLAEDTLVDTEIDVFDAALKSLFTNAPDFSSDLKNGKGAVHNLNLQRLYWDTIQYSIFGHPSARHIHTPKFLNGLDNLVNNLSSEIDHQFSNLDLGRSVGHTLSASQREELRYDFVTEFSDFYNACVAARALYGDVSHLKEEREKARQGDKENNYWMGFLSEATPILRFKAVALQGFSDRDIFSGREETPVKTDDISRVIFGPLYDA